jgi:RHS repeat-associated protein
VLAVVCDKKQVVESTTTTGTVDYFVVEILSASDYSPFGVQLQNREFTSAKYRYGAGRQEKVDEISGSGNHYTALFWEMDPRLGRRWNVDPLAHLRESLSPYNYCSNNPILRVDPTGALDGDYYNYDGTYLGSDGINDDKVYVVNSIDPETASKGMSSSDLLALRDKDFHAGSTDPSATLLPIKHSEFKAIAGTIYAEGTPWNLSFEEAAGIYSVMRNRANASGKSVFDIAGGGGIYGWSERDKISLSGAHQPSVKNAFRGTIEGLTNSKDYSGGGFYWHGSDFAKTTKGSTVHESFYKVGFNFTNSGHDIWNLGSVKSGNSGWDYKYQSTGAAGQTTFMKLTDEWIKANKFKGKW